MNDQQGHGRLGDDRGAAGLSIDDRQFSNNVARPKFSDRLTIPLHSGPTVDYDHRFQPLPVLPGQNRPFADLDPASELRNGVELALAKAAK